MRRGARRSVTQARTLHTSLTEETAIPERFPGPYARDAHRDGIGDDYVRETGWSGAGRRDDYAREPEPDLRGLGPRNYRRPDERIHADVCEALTDDPRVDAREIEVAVDDEVVTL